MLQSEVKPQALHFTSKMVNCTREKLVTNLHAALSEAGLDPKSYAGHSFRIGAATVAHLNGIDDSTIMTLGH